MDLGAGGKGMFGRADARGSGHLGRSGRAKSTRWGKLVTKVMCSIGVGVILASGGSDALANVNLEWRANAATTRAGDTVGVGLYAVSDDGTAQPFAALDAIISWDPAVLRLIGKLDDGPYEWLVSWFPDDSRLSRLNADCGARLFCTPYSGTPYNDGDALFEAIAPFGLNPPPYATAQGLLVATFIFVAQTGSPATDVSFLSDAGPSATIVVGATSYGDVTGELGILTLMVRGCGSTGDFNGDCWVSLFDYAKFRSCLDGPGRAPAAFECHIADMDADTDVDLRDFAAEQLLFGGS